MATPPATEDQQTGESKRGVNNRDPDQIQASRWFVFVVIAAPTLLIFITVSGVLGQLIGDGSPWWRVPALFDVGTPTGADMGAHVLLPKLLLGAWVSICQ